MKSINIKSYCKINLSLRVKKKLSSGYHNIMSLITYCDLHDIIRVSKNKYLKDKIIFSGKFKKKINSKKNTISKLLNLLRKNKLIKNEFFKINIKKNIPHGSGLGGGSSNAASLINYFNSKMKLNLSKKKTNSLATKIGFDVPISLQKKNTFLTGKQNQIIRLKQKFNLNMLIVYPNVICSTKKIYNKNKKITLLKPGFNYKKLNKKKLIILLRNETNDLEETVIKIYPKIGKIIKYIKSLKGCYFSRITGTGSACIGIFSNMKEATYAKKLMKLKYPNYWCVVSKTI